ncbi:ABC-type multidrug transport system fused ATPase/permease subunit [Breznakibacter xylanolyticus]|uniref:ABC-type multidrug transport system fused ATPase/permease subunit n=1 Tax=Breznakibacter xylanolyticus TaxID=990 RepID=A0A2W7MVS7_9BACT|nr:ABC transporter ATP-binding protein/permease [Breznakibacter xylanolyticus]PZX11930.1 ABC-type multidrug transport system fused ATPase/permease subunit [Breznakibacter xylanolyticus]
MLNKTKLLLKNNLIIGTLIKIKDVLPNDYRKKSVRMMLLLFLNSLLEMVGLAAFLPLFSVILQPGMIHSHRLLSPIYNTIGFTSDNQFILALAGIIVFSITVKNTASLLIVRTQAKFSLTLYQYFAKRLHQFYYSKGFPFFKKINSNIILRNINTIPSQFANQMVLPMFNLLTELMILLLILTGLLLYDAKAIFLLALTILPIFLIFYNWVKGRSLRLENEANSIAPKLTQSIFQSVHGFADVEITNTQKRFSKRISDYIGQLVQLNIKRTVYNAAPTKVIETGMVITILAITIYGLYFLPDRAGLTALLGIFALAAYRILPSVNRIMLALISIKGYQFTFDVINEVKGFTPKQTISEKILFEQAIHINNLSFHFPDSSNNVLNHINLTINKGESIGFIGTSGSGKTTLMNLLLGFWQPTEGNITIDGTQLIPSTLQSWRVRIGYVQQEVYIIDASVAENVAFGLTNEEIDTDKLQRVLQQASLWEFVQSLPEKTNTNIGERGTKLSGGQRQRVGISRALYAGADVLFFDEATSALDTQTEEEITESIRSLADGNLTLIIIAHRKSTLKYCTRIVKIEKGNIQGEMKYNDLL